MSPLLELLFSCSIVVAVATTKKTNLKRRPLFRSQIFSISECCDIQGSHLIGYLRVSLIIDLFCIELPENCIFLNPSELSNFFMCIISIMITIIIITTIIIILIMTIVIIKIIFKTWLFVDMEFFLWIFEEKIDIYACVCIIHYINLQQ